MPSSMATEPYEQNWSNPHTLNGYVMKEHKSNWSQFECKMLMVFLWLNLNTHEQWPFLPPLFHYLDNFPYMTQTDSKLCHFLQVPASRAVSPACHFCDCGILATRLPAILVIVFQPCGHRTSGHRLEPHGKSKPSDFIFIQKVHLLWNCWPMF